MPNPYCVFNMTTASCLITMANWTEVCLAINRALAICLPHHYSRICSRKVIIGMLLTCWVIVGIVSPAGAYGWGGQYRVIFINQCVYAMTGWLGDFFVAMVMFLPMALSGSCCALILVKSVILQRQQSLVTAGVSGVVSESGGTTTTNRRRANNSHMHRRLEIAVILFTSFLWGAACDLPFMVMMERYEDVFLHYPILTVWIHFILDAQYSVSPVCFVHL